jgi:hypothetical protein
MHGILPKRMPTSLPGHIIFRDTATKLSELKRQSSFSRIY